MIVRRRSLRMSPVRTASQTRTSPTLIEMTDGRGLGAIIDAVRVEAKGHHMPAAKKLVEVAQNTTERYRTRSHR